ncbi:transposase [Streptomyces sp. NPDC048251]|uniref:transposase n=1 Tax=Streptomyces sp. NPDC048251 TaxID=3154501 RepID=UPI0034155572
MDAVDETAGGSPAGRHRPGRAGTFALERLLGLPHRDMVADAVPKICKALVRGIPPIRSRRGPRRRRPAKLHGDKGYDFDRLRAWLRSRNITPRIARRGLESSQRLGRHRWTVERTVAWLSGCRRLHRRYERKADHFLAFAGIAATLICYRRLTA